MLKVCVSNCIFVLIVPQQRTKVCIDAREYKEYKLRPAADVQDFLKRLKVRSIDPIPE